MAASAKDTPAPGVAFEPAGFGPRFAALMIDWALCLLISSLYANPFAVGWPAVLLLIIVNTVFIGLFGQTPGMALGRVRCVSYADGGAIGLWRGLIRALLLALFIPALILNSEARGLHDRAAGSIVVALPRPTRT